MIQTTVENGQTLTNLSNLSRWEKNPKFLLKEDHDRLVEQILDLGQYKPLLVLGEVVNVKGETFPEGAVIGGNGRWLVYTEQVQKGEGRYQNVWISVLTFQFIPDSAMWYAVINGEVQTRRTFQDPLQAMIEYSQSDNDQAGKTDRQALVELVHPYQEVIPMDNYKIQVYDQQPLREIVENPNTDKKEVRDDSKEEKEEQELEYITIKLTKDQYQTLEPIMDDVKQSFDITGNTDLFTKLLEWWTLSKDVVSQVKITPNGPTDDVVSNVTTVSEETENEVLKDASTEPSGTVDSTETPTEGDNDEDPSNPV